MTLGNRSSRLYQYFSYFLFILAWTANLAGLLRAFLGKSLGVGGGLQESRLIHEEPVKIAL